MHGVTITWCVSYHICEYYVPLCPYPRRRTSCSDHLQRSHSDLYACDQDELIPTLSSPSFPKSIVRIKISDFDFLATTLDPTTTFSPLHPCHPIAQVDLPHDSAAILMFPTDPERPGLFPLKRCFRHIIHRIGSKDLLENGVVPSDERMVYLAYRQAVDIAKRCEYAIERVELKLKVEEDTEEQRPFGEHAFCCATTTEREKKWDPKIVIPCCDFDCRKPKTLFENFREWTIPRAGVHGRLASTRLEP